ncbi:hypothetical protein FIBSPDRAFT_937034 [Athelia psychrophila]|uniref:Uncharacterized protein n=1 Tax=Athelia psychrophila TaxID=1759441 RepID=A0A166B4D5_9AGAM|nr:hypothetical protein FIBSPDRAFT_937034 [Fibularhizoctonia sp. CBS 109695]
MAHRARGRRRTSSASVIGVVGRQLRGLPIEEKRSADTGAFLLTAAGGGNLSPNFRPDDAANWNLCIARLRREREDRRELRGDDIGDGGCGRAVPRMAEHHRRSWDDEYPVQEDYFPRS